MRPFGMARQATRQSAPTVPGFPISKSGRPSKIERMFDSIPLLRFPWRLHRGIAAFIRLIGVQRSGAPITSYAAGDE